MKLKKEKPEAPGRKPRNRVYSSENSFPGQDAAEAFERAVDKLFVVGRWTKLPGISSTFEVFDTTGRPKNSDPVNPGDFIRIQLPAPVPENWVHVTDKQQSQSHAEFTVRPCEKPLFPGHETEEIRHFFTDESHSTFRVELAGNRLKASEIGVNEKVNNKGEKAGNRKVINTLVAYGGWAGFQAFQWKKLTDYLVHETELDGSSGK